MNPILIPSKDRAKKNYLLEQLQKNNLEFYYFIEPQEIKKYTDVISIKNIINIKENDMGIAYVRNFILKYAQKNKIKRYWTLDDDLNNFYHREEKKMIKNDISVLSKVEKQFANNFNADEYLLLKPTDWKDEVKPWYKCKAKKIKDTE